MDQVINPELGRAIHFDRAGNPISPRQWSALFSDIGYKIVVEDRVLGTRVVTVWSGIDIDCGLFHDGPPNIFGTMVFGGPHNFDGREWTWPTEDTARRGHVHVQKLVRGHAQLQKLVRQNGGPL